MGLSTIAECPEALIKSRPEEAKDLLSAAIRDLTGVERDIAKIKLAIAYTWAGEFSECLAVVEDLLSENLTDEVRFRALLAKATCQINTPKAALLTLDRAEPYLESVDFRFRGMWHNGRARALKKLKDYDRAVIEYAGAASYFDQSGDPSCAAGALNNVAGVYLKWGRYDDAHEAVKKAVAAFRALDDPLLAHAQDQEAQVLIAKGFPDEAKKILDPVIRDIEGGDKKELLLECLLTRARALMDLRLTIDAFRDVDRGQELAEYLSRPDLRLNVARTRKEIASVCAVQSHIEMVELALAQSNGAVRVAAQKLGLNHTSLIAFIKNHGLDRKAPRRKTILTK